MDLNAEAMRFEVRSGDRRGRTFLVAEWLASLLYLLATAGSLGRT